MKTAIFVDGGFYRIISIRRLGSKTPKERADELEEYCMSHVNYEDDSELLKIFYYDCPPVVGNVYHPYYKQEISLIKNSQYEWNLNFIEELKKKRKFVLRLGSLNERQAKYVLKHNALKSLCNGEISVRDLKEDDFLLELPQKGVDVRIGLDIASIAYKKQAEQMILISGDSDFIPAAKLARREGIDFILDPLGSYIKPEMIEHVDGIRSICVGDNCKDYSFPTFDVIK